MKLSCNNDYVYMRTNNAIISNNQSKDLGWIPFLCLTPSPYPFPLVLRVHVRVRAVPILILIEG